MLTKAQILSIHTLHTDLPCYRRSRHPKTDKRVRQGSRSLASRGADKELPRLQVPITLRQCALIEFDECHQGDVEFDGLHRDLPLPPTEEQSRHVDICQFAGKDHPLVPTDVEPEDRHTQPEI
ncbi:hypothetical protein MML48_4g00007281 [Holotrichia oblita]|uniref:Uncharacterized protein n=1 Tax=Holotrichia oblita TaxID=644536 RepID=A0ACB9T6W5_HOLOL|nr:hypothetical protein MML48_4g00007281 [Holotrichia oblita]